MEIDLEKLKKVSQPLMDYLRDNFHPHVTAVVDSENTQIVEGVASVKNSKDVFTPQTRTNNSVSNLNGY